MKIYKITKRGDKWVVTDESGEKVLGEHENEEDAKKQLAAIEASKAKSKKMEAFGVQVDFEDLATITDVDVFAVGTWHGANSLKEGDKYEENDLQNMVDAFEAGVVNPAIKVTHGDDNEQIDVGKVSNLRVRAGKLFADFVNVPKALYELMKKGLFKARSAEVLWNVEKDGKKWPRVLKAVALLAPGQRPAVTGISEGYTFAALYCYEWPQDNKSDSKHKEVNTMLEALLKKYDARDEAHLEEILDGNLAELEEARQRAEQANRKAEEYEARETEARKKAMDSFIESATKDGHILPKEHELVRGIFEDVLDLEETKEYQVADGKQETGTVLERLYFFVKGLGKRIEPGELSKKGKDDTVDDTRKPAAEVYRLQREYIKTGEAKDEDEAMKLIQKNEPELYTRWIKGE